MELVEYNVKIPNNIDHTDQIQYNLGTILLQYMPSNDHKSLCILNYPTNLKHKLLYIRAVIKK